ncbi:MAG TPA: TraB/GumN family protein [Chitinophagales bacterium]|nr:TraB/GumN family protein [Chitinophagales bacterium]
MKNYCFKALTFFCFLLITLSITAQDKKYQGLLWKISGNGMSKPSYLYGTMHVSNKVAFHLGDAFFKAIDSVSEVALELNPDTWLEEYMNSQEFLSSFSTNFYFTDYSTNDPFEKTLDIYKYQKPTIEAELSTDPALINTFMFRSDKSKADFQEDTYLDLYIYQTAKKLGKTVHGLESLPELNRDNDNAERAKAHEDNSIKRGKSNYMFDGGDKIEEAYRRGDLYDLDSLNALLSTDSTREYIIFKRNKVMVARMVAIMKNHPLFTGVGAAHLPGEKGVIELLRAQGYTVEPVDMGERDAEKREQIENMKVERKFSAFSPPDSLFSVEIPKPVFCVKERWLQQNYLSADMVNGIYYTVSRIKSYAELRHFSKAKVQKMVDSLLYENVPGKIIEQKDIEKNGYPGTYVLNKTRKGDYQAYNIFFTGPEIIIFKVSGTGESAKGEYGQRFLNSIVLSNRVSNNWQTVTAADSSFSVLLPGKPVNYLQHPPVYSGNKTDLIATDTTTGNAYMVVRTTISNPDYFEEDTFEMSLMAESFGDKNLYKERKRWWTELNGRKALQALYATPDSQIVEALFINQNLNFYTLAVYYTNDSSNNNRFLTSLKTRLPVYMHFETFNDSILHFSVQLPYKHIISNYMKTWSYGTLNANPVKFQSKLETFTVPGSFETVEVKYYQYCPYYQNDDTAEFIKRRRKYESKYGDFIIKGQSSSLNKGDLTVNFLLTDTNTSKQLYERILMRNGLRYTISAYIDTLLGPSKFVQQFLESFAPADTVIGTSLFTDHSQIFLNDILSTDSLTRVHALDQADEAEFTNTSYPSLIKAFDQIPATTSYADIKTALYLKFADVKTKAALPYLKKAYFDAGDTSQFQFAILYSLAKMHTTDAISLFGKLVTSETPLSDERKDIYEAFAPLYDSVALSKNLFPDLLDLITIDEYRYEVFSMLADLLDSNLVKPSLYKNYKGIILNQAKLELKRESGARKTASGDKENNYKLQNYITILMPFHKEEKVRDYFDRLIKTDNPYVKMALAIKLEKNKEPVGDSVWYDLAKDEKRRVYLYSQLKKNNMESLYPEKFKTQAQFNESILKGFIPSETNTLDSVVLLVNTPIDYRGEKGRVYLYKYKVKKDKNWKLAMLGLQPEDENKVDSHYELFDIRNEYLDNNKTAEEQLHTLILKWRKRKKYDN